MSAKPTNRELAAIARRAADIIQARGKATGGYEDHLGRVCTLGALGVAATGTAYASGDVVVRWELARRCIATMDPRPTDLATWSDLPTTTEADIARVFLQVADDLEVAR